jgi:hypothetical protein
MARWLAAIRLMGPARDAHFRDCVAVHPDLAQPYALETIPSD